MYFTGSLGGSSMRSSVDRPEAGDVTDGADALAVGLPHRLDPRADAQALQAFGDDVGQGGVCAAELHQDEGERRRRWVEPLDGLVHDGDGRHHPGVRHRDPLAALGAGGLGVAEGWDHHALTRYALSPDAALVAQAREESSDGLAGRVLVGKLESRLGEHRVDGLRGHEAPGVVHQTNVCQGRRRSGRARVGATRRRLSCRRPPRALGSAESGCGGTPREVGMKRLLATYDSWALTGSRLALGLVMFPHGAQKMLGWFGGNGFTGTMGFFTSQGIPAPLAFLAIVAEFFGSLG